MGDSTGDLVSLLWEERLLLLSLFDLSLLDMLLSDGDPDDLENLDTAGDPPLSCLLGELPYDVDIDLLSEIALIRDSCYHVQCNKAE